MALRSAGILLHLTSLAGPFGCGDMGPAAFGFAQRLAACGQSLWQILPLTPTGPGRGDSPYNSSSAFAGDYIFISLERLAAGGLLSAADLAHPPDFDPAQADFLAARTYKLAKLRQAFANWQAAGTDALFERFSARQAHWLDDYALFATLSQEHSEASWTDWPGPLGRRDPKALDQARRELAPKLKWHRFCQYIFQRQWQDLRDHCQSLGVRMLGDAPIYVDLNSADVWSHPELFKLDENSRPLKQAGVPPDYFSATGQLWGNPVYDWQRMAQDGFAWWISRVERNLELFDLLRIDHFRGLVAYWEVPAGDKTAENGKWVNAPVYDFLQTLFRRIPQSAIVAEDLGTITPDVREVMGRFGLPGMRLLLFAFGDGPDHAYLPHNLSKDCIAYTGTHDNNTAQGWLNENAGQDQRRHLFEYLGREMADRHVVWEMIRMLYMSPAQTVIIPLQDVLGLGGEARMNRPSVPSGNWTWRATQEQIDHADLDFLGEMARRYGRAPG